MTMSGESGGSRRTCRGKRWWFRPPACTLEEWRSVLNPLLFRKDAGGPLQRQPTDPSDAAKPPDEPPESWLSSFRRRVAAALCARHRRQGRDPRNPRESK
jgi:hypothetical protein